MAENKLNYIHNLEQLQPKTLKGAAAAAAAPFRVLIG
jgi:hypothetical protein